MLRIDSRDDASQVESAVLSEVDFLEDDLREWILQHPHPVLGEDVLMIGREVEVSEIGDAIDLLAIDRDGNIVVIELKRGSLKSDVDFQALKYAAYASHWSYENLRDQFEEFKSSQWGRNLYDEDATFRESLEAFCNDDYTLNQDQRLFLVGERVQERIELVVQWLSDRGVDATVIEFQLFQDDGRHYLTAKQTIPVPDESGPDVSPDTSEKPWKDDGKSWHRDEVADEETGELLEEVVAAIENLGLLEGPEWGQKQYVAFNQDRKRRVAVRTHTTLFHVDVYDIPVSEISPETVADELDIPRNTVTVEGSLRGGRPGLRITCQGGQNIDTASLAEQVEKAVLMTDD